ncbi:hypothetical protein ACFQ1M_12730 [Sungkyunkwania multivorans]|uniref:Uncharacterized protein n=1 Tax=Sungkyunkwania multivorans TaxID=1173618 RepID=A0ABW3D1S1_9FLAO
MNAIFKYCILGLMSLAGISSLYFSLLQEFDKSTKANCLLLIAMIAYHLLFGKRKNILLIKVLSLFLASSVVSVASEYFPDASLWFQHAGNLLVIAAIVLILFKIVKETEALLVVDKYLWLIFLIIAVDAYIIYEITGLIVKFDLSFNHLFTGFSYPIVKLIVLSVAFVYYLANANKYRRANFLVIAVFGYFLQDVVEGAQYLLFVNDALPGLNLLSTGFFMLGLWFFYLYCTKPKIAFEG